MKHKELMPEEGNKAKVVKRVSLTLFFCLTLPIYVYSSPAKIIKINNDSPYTSSYTVSLDLSVEDVPLAGEIILMSFSNNNSFWSTRERYSPTKTWGLSPLGDVTGERKINIGDSLFIAQYLVKKRSLTPEQIALADVNQNKRIDIGDALFIAQYLVKKRTMPVVEGERSVYVKFKDAAGRWSEPYSDTIILDTIPSKIASLTPADGSTYYEDDEISSLVKVYELDHSPVEYQFSVDGAIKQPWSPDSSFPFKPGLGLHKLTAETQDTAGGDSKEAQVYVLRRPISPP
jgi:hypothetical protein